MSRRRARGEGTIRQRTDGRWEARVTVGYGEDGRQRQRSIYGATEAEVAAKLVELRLRPTGAADGERLTLGQFLDEWLRYREAPPDGEPLKALTVHSYRTLAKLYIKPDLGGVPLARLRPLHISRLLASLSRAGLAPHTIRNVRAVLANALRAAVEWEVLATSPVPRTVRRRRRKATPPASWSAAHLVTFLEAVKSHRLGALFYTMATTGLREGEALALRISDADLDGGRLRVARSLAYIPRRGLEISTPKTERSRRVVPLPADTVAELRAHLARLDQEKKDAAELWRDSGLLFPSTVGGAIFPRNLIRVFDGIVAGLAVPRLTIHGLRHTYASLALRSGLPLRDLSDRLGHYDPAFTLSVYTHVLPDAPVEALTLAELTATAAVKAEASPPATAADGGAEPVN